MKTTTLLIALSFVTVPAFAASEPAQSEPAPAPNSAPAQEAAGELAERQAELNQVTREISDLQTKAESTEAVKAPREAYHATLRTEMVRAAPQLEADIDRQTALVEELTTELETTNQDASAEAEPDAAKAAESRDAKIAEYRTLREKLTPVERSAQEVPAVKTARSTYYSALISAMERIEPKTQDLLAKHRELTAVVRELSAQARSG